MVPGHIDQHGLLAQTDRLVVELKLHIARQCALSLHLAMRGRDTAEAEARIQFLANTLATVQAHRQALLRELDDFP